MRFHLLDRIDHWVPGESATGVKAVTRTVALPARLPVVESLAQLASYLLGDAEAREGRTVMSLMTGIDAMRFYRDARPGDQLALQARIQARSIDGARVAVSAAAGEEPVCEGRLTFAYFTPDGAAQLQDFDWAQAHRRLLMRGLDA